MPDIMLTYSEKEDQAAVLVTLLIERRDKEGRVWQSSVVGRGLDRRDAVAAAIPGDNLMNLRRMVLKVAEDKYADAPAEQPPAAAPARVPAQTVATEAVAPVVEVPQSPKENPLPEDSGLRQPASSNAPAGESSSISSISSIASPSLTGHKRGWPKGKPRGPRKAKALSLPTPPPITASTSTTSDGTPGDPSLTKTEGQESPPQSSEVEPF